MNACLLLSGGIHMNKLISLVDGMDDRPPLILIIEDEVMILEMETLILERAGCRVCGFGSGEEALAAPTDVLREVRVALVDAVFGGVDAVEALRRINPEIRTAIVTGMGFEPHPAVDRVIHLPFLAEDLVGHVRELLAN